MTACVRALKEYVLHYNHWLDPLNGKAIGNTYGLFGSPCVRHCRLVIIYFLISSLIVINTRLITAANVVVYQKEGISPIYGVFEVVGFAV